MSKPRYELDSGGLIESVVRLTESMLALSANLTRNASVPVSNPVSLPNQDQTSGSAKSWIAEFTQGFDSLTNQVDRTVRGVIFGTERIKVAFARMAASIALELAKSGLQAAVGGAGKNSPWLQIFGEKGQGGNNLASMLARGGIFDALKTNFQHTLQQMLTNASQWVANLGAVFLKLGAEIVQSLGGPVKDAFSELFGLLDKEKFKSAEAAAAAAADSAAKIPYVGWILAPAAAATVFAAAMAFDQGGLVPRDTLAMVHQGEIVVPTRFADLMRSGEFALSSGGDVHIHVGSISANTPTDLSRELDRFGDKIGDIVKEQYRAGRYLRGRY